MSKTFRRNDRDAFHDHDELQARATWNRFEPNRNARKQNKQQRDMRTAKRSFDHFDMVR
jgi:hypothetical protein